MDTMIQDVQIQPKKRRQQPKKLVIVDDMTGQEFMIPYWKHLYGTEPKNIKIRSCLRCQSRFPSAGPQNRLCNACNLMIESKALDLSEEVKVLHSRYRPILQVKLGEN